MQRATTPDLLPQQLEQFEWMGQNKVTGLGLCPVVPPCQGKPDSRAHRAVSIMSGVAKEDHLFGSDLKHLKERHELFRTLKCVCEERGLWKPLESIEFGSPRERVLV